MNIPEVRATVLEELGNIAPEIDMKSVNASDDLREALDIDSMDFLNFIAAIHRRLGVDVPELDYSKLITINGAVTYLENKLGARMA